MPQYTVHHRQEPVKLSGDQEHLKAQFLELGEEWTVSWHNILALDPRYFQAYLRLRSIPHKNQHLSRKVQELVLLAIEASVSHLRGTGIRAHTIAALRAGASKHEILEVLELTSVLGIHAMNTGMPLLQEVLAEKGVSLTNGVSEKSNSAALTPEQEQLKTNFLAQRSYYDPGLWDPILRACPEFFEAYTQFSNVPFAPNPQQSKLSQKTKELIFVAIDCAPTHLFAEGAKVHMRNAIDQGATVEEVTEVLQLASLMGVQTVMKGADVLVEELEGRGEAPHMGIHLGHKKGST